MCKKTSLASISEKRCSHQDYTIRLKRELGGGGGALQGGGSFDIVKL